MSLVCKRVRIEGRVQGVGYRAWTSSTARKIGLKGWVRNRFDGTVEAVFCGAEPEVNQMIEACWTGPLAARVETIHIEDYTDTEGLQGFATQPTVS